MKRFNWIDVVILLVLVAVVAVVGIKLMSKPTEGVKEDASLSTPNLRVEVLCQELLPEEAENIILSLQSAPREVNGAQVEMTRIFNSNNLVDACITTWVIEESPTEGFVNLRLTVEANAVLSKGNYSIGTQEIRIGKGYTAKTMGMETEGTIVAVTELSK
jgi:hypothetical protein